MTNSDIMINYLFGAISGVCATTISHPFFTLKTQIQNENTVTAKNYTSIKWLYSGLFRAMIGYSIEKMLVFGTYNSLRNRDINPTICGMLSGIVAAFSVTPFEQLTIDKQNNIRIFSIRHLYAGILPTIMRESLGFAVHFTAYEKLTNIFNQERDTCKTILCGTGAVICGWGTIAPFDRVKTQIQCGNFNLSKYNIRASYAGFQFALMRAIPFHATCFVVMEELKKTFNAGGYDTVKEFD